MEEGGNGGRLRRRGEGGLRDGGGWRRWEEEGGGWRMMEERGGGRGVEGRRGECGGERVMEEDRGGGREGRGGIGGEEEEGRVEGDGDIETCIFCRSSWLGEGWYFLY